MMALLTDWFPPSVKPELAGEYNACAEERNPLVVRWWNGEYWSAPYYADDPKGLRDKCIAKRGMYQDVEWRGLANDPADAVLS